MTVSKETVNLIKDGVNGAVDLATTGVTTLVDETINLYLFYGVLGILKAAIVFVVYFIIKKFLDAMLEATSDKKEINKLKALKSAAIVISLIFFTVKTMPHIHDMGKALVAPNLFLAEKAADLLKEKKSE